MLDAYTIKKVIPRLLLAVIFVNLSWFITTAMLGISNVIGNSIAEFILAPFSGLSGQIFQGLSGAGVAEANILAVFTALGITFFSSWAILLPVLMAAAFGLLFAYITLVVRQVVIIAMIILSPIAIVLWVLPGTEAIAKKWFSAYTKILLMYPLIIVFLVSGKIASEIILELAGSNGGAGLQAIVLQVAAIIAFFAPYFLIPFTYKFVGGAIATIGGFMNDRSKGVVDGTRKWAGGRSAQNRQRALAGTRWNEKGVGKLANRITGGIGAGPRGAFGFGQRGRTRLSANARAYSTERMKDPLWQAIQHDDAAMRAATYATAADARAAGISEDAIRKVEGSIGFNKANQIAASQQMLLNKTAYRDSADVAETIARVADGNADIESSLRGYNNAYAKQVGRHDLSSVSTRAIELARDPVANQADLAAQQRIDTMAGFNNADTYTLGRENSTSYTNMSDAYAAEYHDAVQTYIADPSNVQARDRVIAARTGLEEIIKNANSATGNNATTAMVLADYIGTDDEALRAGTADSGRSIIGGDTQVPVIDPSTGAPAVDRAGNPVMRNVRVQGAAEGSVGDGGSARAQRSLSEAERRARESTGSKPPGE